jgi:TonB family protein
VKGFRRAWFKAVYAADQTVPQEYQAAVSKNLRSYRSEVTVRYFDCREWTSAVMRHFWESADGTQSGYFYHPQLTFLKVEPRSLDEKMLHSVCYSSDLVSPEAAGVHLPGATPAKMVRPVNPDDYYPLAAQRRNEEGSPIVQACVGSSGQVLREPTILETSGFPDLDHAAINVAKATRYAAGTENGSPLSESCIEFKILFRRHKQE